MDLITLSLYFNHVNIIIQQSNQYAKKQKLVVNTKNCDWFVHGKNINNNTIFKLNQNKLRKADNLIHLQSKAC